AVIGDVLSFGPATPLPLVSPGPDPSYPRARMAAGGEELVFSARKMAGSPDTDIALALRDGDAWQDGVFGTGVGITTLSPEWAPLRLPAGVQVPDVVGAELILFNAFNPGGRRQIYAATPDAATKTAVPNLNDPLKDSYSPAMAWELNPPRYWYMRRIGAADQLRFVTQRAGELTATPIAAVSLPGGCTVDLALTPDLAPWVTPNGSHLFFQADYPAACDNEAQARRGFWVPLTPITGVPTGPAEEIPIEGIAAGQQVSTPSLSPDLCSLYFSTTDANGALALHAARRR
ncbi:MAG TPA: hypothetical protein VLS89_07575, partial [Candidatus Nanopelagicales bacterium]|nr:hypothetical protein [Candidatus Nanopelagicales bacterium]